MNPNPTKAQIIDRAIQEGKIQSSQKEGLKKLSLEKLKEHLASLESQTSESDEKQGEAQTITGDTTETTDTQAPSEVQADSTDTKEGNTGKPTAQEGEPQAQADTPPTDTSTLEGEGVEEATNTAGLGAHFQARLTPVFVKESGQSNPLYRRGGTLFGKEWQTYHIEDEEALARIFADNRIERKSA